MKKSLLAIAIPAALVANTVSAVQLYNDEVNTFAIGGHIAVGFAGSEEGDTEIESLSPRLNVEVTRDLGEGFLLDARSEWALNVLEGGEESFSTRLGYIGLTHDTYGRTVIGTQWSPYYSVAGIAERTVAFGNHFLYNNHYNLGTARAERMASYSKVVELGDAGAITMAAGWQGKHTESNTDDYDTRMQAALTYQVMDFSLGYAYNGGDVAYASVGNEQNALSNVFSAKYGAYGKGLYVAAVYADNEYMYQHDAVVLEETVQIEAIAAYALDNSLNFSVNYESVEDDKASETVFSQLAFNVEYNFLKDVRGYAGYQFDLGSDGTYDKADDDKFAIGVRVYL